MEVFSQPELPLRPKPVETAETLALRASLGLERCKLRPYIHQVYGIQFVVDHPFCALFDEMGAGKTIQTIVAAQILFHRGIIDKVLVLAPASVRGVWFDQELGELRKHLWDDTNVIVMEYHAKTRRWESANVNRALQITVTNYEFVGRSKNRLQQLLPFCTPKTLLVLDESSSIKNYRAQQTKAVLELRRNCGRVVLLNGTPIANNPLDMFSQGNMMHPSILQCKYITLYRSRYAIMAPNSNFPQIIGWQNLEDLQRRFAPYVLRRLKKDCLDLPEKLPPVTLEAELTLDTWKIYREMRDQMVAWVSDRSVSVASQAIVKALRLSQITSGFLGGIAQEIQDEELFEEVEQNRPSFIQPFEARKCASAHEWSNDYGDDWHPEVGTPCDCGRKKWGMVEAPQEPVKEIGSEKQDVLLWWWRERLEQEPNLKLLTFGRFKPEVLRLIEAVRKESAFIVGMKGETGLIVGSQKKGEREQALRLFDPRTAPEGPAFVAGTYGTGSKGLNLVACHTIVNISFDYSLEKFLQSADRIHRPGQIHACSFFDIVAVGPKGQKTIDHAIVKARRNKEDIATWTQAAWLEALKE